MQLRALQFNVYTSLLCNKLFETYYKIMTTISLYSTHIISFVLLLWQFGLIRANLAYSIFMLNKLNF